MASHLGINLIVMGLMSRQGGEVMAIDRDIDRVERVKDEVAYAVALDATDPKVLEAHALHQVDVAISAIGDDFEAVVLIAVSDILTPEKEVAHYVSQRLINPGIVDLLRLSDEYRIVELYTPEQFWGKTLMELNLRERFNCHIIAIKPRLLQPRRLQQPRASLYPMCWSCRCRRPVWPNVIVSLYLGWPQISNA